MTNLGNFDVEVTKFDIDVPAWIDQDITCYDVAAITQGGCASGAYMPAVTYHEAQATMAEYGDDVLDFIVDRLGELPKPNDTVSWSEMAVFYLSAGVELWAQSVEDELQAIIDDMPAYAFGRSVVGCLPDHWVSFESFDDAKQYLIDQLKEKEESLTDQKEYTTDGDELAVLEDMATNYCHAAEDANLESKPFDVVLHGEHYWVSELDTDQAIEIALNGE